MAATFLLMKIPCASEQRRFSDFGLKIFTTCPHVRVPHAFCFALIMGVFVCFPCYFVYISRSWVELLLSENVNNSAFSTRFEEPSTFTRFGYVKQLSAGKHLKI